VSDDVKISPGQLWESVGGGDEHQGKARGLCLVVDPNDSTESPGSWIMRCLADGQTLYMRRDARLAGLWARRGMLAALER
jgi:hypothetical protein